MVHACETRCLACSGCSVAVAKPPETQEHADQGHSPWRPLVSAVSQVLVSSGALSLPAFRKVLLRAVPAAVAGLLQKADTWCKMASDP